MERPLQVYIEQAELARLEAWARARGWTKSQAVRLAIRALTHSGADDPILSVSGMIDGLPADASQRFDRYLAETFVAEKSARYRTRERRPRKAVRR